MYETLEGYLTQVDVIEYIKWCDFNNRDMHRHSSLFDYQESMKTI